MLWGMTRALDLQAELNLKCGQSHEKSDSDSQEESNTLHILLVGTSDARHVIKTLAQCYKHKERHISFFLYEHYLEVMAREILLLFVALEPPDKLGLLEKARIFMELYGNAFLRPSTAAYLSKTCNHLIHLVTDEEYLKKVIPVFEFSYLKYKDRDHLEDVFKFWKSLDSSFDMNKHWDQRLRNMLGTRYDSREGVFDWDYHMVLKDRGSEFINFQEYKQFRKNGVSFTWLETEYAITNPTFAAYIIRHEGKLRHQGYIGDIVSGPFYCYGLQTEHKDLTRKVNDVYVKKATDVTERNLMQYFHELQHKSSYNHKSVKDETNCGVVITEITSAPTVSHNDREMKVTNVPVSNAAAEEFQAILLPRATVAFLTISDKGDNLKKPRFKALFDVIVISQNSLHLLTKDLMSVASKDALLIVESRKFLLSLNKDNLKDFSSAVDEKAQECGFEKVQNFDPKIDEYAFFRKRKQLEE